MPARYLVGSNNSPLSDFKSKILNPRHKQRLIELDSLQNRFRITPRGIEYVEQNLLVTR